jgi:hypothetical protein
MKRRKPPHQAQKSQDGAQQGEQSWQSSLRSTASQDWKTGAFIVLNIKQLRKNSPVFGALV